MFTDFLQELITDDLLLSSNLSVLDPRQLCFNAFNLTTLETKSHPHPHLQINVIRATQVLNLAQNWLRSAESSSTRGQINTGSSESIATTKQEDSTLTKSNSHLHQPPSKNLNQTLLLIPTCLNLHQKLLVT
jgi:hypothetical protein